MLRNLRVGVGRPYSPWRRCRIGWDRRSHRNKGNCKHSTSAGDVPQATSGAWGYPAPAFTDVSSI